MPTISQRIASAFAVLCGRYGDVTRMAGDRDRARQSLYREAETVVEAVEGTAAEARLEQLRRRLADQEAENRDLRSRLDRAVEITRDTQDEFAAVAQAEGVSLGVARRLLQVVAGAKPGPSVATLGRATREAGRRAGALLGVPDEAARPRVEHAAADEIFWAEPGPHGGRARAPLLDHRADRRVARWGHLGPGVRPAAGARAVVRDDGTGLGKGVRLDNARRRDAGLPEFDQALDVFHTLREGGRAVRQDLGRRHAAPWSGPRRLRRPSIDWAARGDHARVMARRPAGCGVRPSTSGTRPRPPRQPGIGPVRPSSSSPPRGGSMTGPTRRRS